MLQGVRRRYERKRISDQSLTCDSTWLLFGIVQSIELVFNGWWWIFTGLAGFFIYKMVAKVGFSLAAPRPEVSGARSCFSCACSHWGSAVVICLTRSANTGCARGACG